MLACALRIERHRGERGGGHLIKERLEEVMILPVDQRDLRLDVAQRLGDVEPGESAAQDHDVGVGLVDGSCRA
jgi:hypothetical protein